MTKFATIATAAVLALTAGAASAADFDNDIGGSFTATTTVLKSQNIAIGRNVKADQGNICVKSTRTGGSFKATTTVLKSQNIAIGRNVEANQGSVQVGKGC